MKTMFCNFKETAPLVMGIVNVTPDSFSDGGQFLDADLAFRHIESLSAQGADILDIGAQSTRPGAVKVSVSEEIARLAPVLSRYRTYFNLPLSLDTTSAEVAEWAISLGVDMINDVSALTEDSRMGAVIGAAQLPVILMHKQGSPQTMQVSPSYSDVVQEVIAYLSEQATVAKNHGILDIILDPGIGFGKTLTHNLQLLKHVDQIVALGYPVLMGTSRKSFIGELTGNPVGDRLAGTIASCVLAYQFGATLFRVHDVGAVKKALRVAQGICEGRP